MAEYQLSKLRAGNTGLPAAQKADWVEVSFDGLGKLAQSLDCSQEFPSGVSVDAIPDVWGKALVFAYALADPEHPFHRKAVDSFRGFIRMLANRRRRGLELTAMRVDTTDENNRFLRVACEAPPSGSFAQNLDWTQLQVIVLEEEVVGFTSPLTLFLPCEGMEMLSAEREQFVRNGRFADPIPDLDESSAADLAGYVEYIVQELDRIPPGTPDLYHKVLGRALTSFHEELRAKSGGTITPFTPDGDTLGLGAPYDGLLGYALQPREVESDVALHTTPPLSEKILILSENTPQVWGVHPRDIVVADGYTHAAVQPGNLLRLQNLPGVTCRRPEDFLCNELFAIRSGNAAPDTVRVRGVRELQSTRNITPLLPISKELAGYLPADVLERATFRSVGNDIEFSIDLPVGREGSRTIRATRRYSRVEHIDTLEFPVCAVWPGKAPEGWRNWFSICSSSHLISAKYLVKPLRAAEDREERTGGTDAKIVVTRSEVRPVVFTVEQKVATGIKNVGLLLAAHHPVTQNASGKTAQIGVDFGTSSTQVYIKVDGEPPKPLRFDEGLPTLNIGSGSSEQFSTELHRYFIPAGNPVPEGPLASIVRRRPGPGDNRPRPVADAHVLFYSVSHADQQLKDQGVFTHLKWEPGFKSYRVAYNLQLTLAACLQAILDGAQKIRVRYSYPSAFSAVERSTYEGEWNTIIDRLKDCLPAGVEVSSGDPPTLTESLAAASYFANNGHVRALLSAGSLIIDIGGGTSDISVWRNGQLELQTSVRWSGRQILLDGFRADRASACTLLFDQLGFPEFFRAKLQSAEDEEFYKYADALLRSAPADLTGNLRLAMGSPEFLTLASHIALTFGGLLYYCGILMRNRGFAAAPRIFAGGNGSRIVDWIWPSNYSHTALVHDLFHKAICAGAKLPQTQRLDLIPSQEPKSEAALGLLNPVQNMAPGDDRLSIPAGEAYEVNGRFVDATDNMVVGEHPELGSLDELRNWICGVYNPFVKANKGLLLPLPDKEVEDILARALDDTRDRLGFYARVDDAERETEPLFITGLRSAVKYISGDRGALHAAAR